MTKLPETLGALKRSPFGVPDRALRSVKDEMRQNLLARLCTDGPLFEGVLGYEDTVMPQIVNAILSRHNFILLGLRGQAKSRILRALTTLLDDAMPIVAGSEVNDNPFAPISKFARDAASPRRATTRRSRGSGREQRYVEKLATPDVTIADLIGDLDPIKAARGGHLLSDELTIHYGMLPRANRGIFALNELPDLAGKVQVGLFNVMQEGDVQIKGYPVRLALDVLLCFTANPEDLHGARQDHHAAQGPHRQRDPHALSRRPSSSAWRSPGRRRGRRATASPGAHSRLRRRSRRARRVRGARRPARRQALRRVAAHADHACIENVVSNAERRAVTHGRGRDRAAHLGRLRRAARRSPASSNSSTRASSWAAPRSRAN